MTARVSQTTVAVGFSPIATSSSKAFIQMVQRKQQHAFKLADALRDEAFLRGFIQDSTELLRQEKNDDNLKTIVLGIGFIKELLPKHNEPYELIALHIGCWMECFKKTKQFK